MSIYKQILQIIDPNLEAMKTAVLKWNSIAKPLGSLGRLEEALIKIAGIKGKAEDISLQKTALIIMCADHGVIEEGVTQTGQEVTKIVAENFTTGNTSVCIMAKSSGTDIYPVDIGMNTEEYPEGKILPSRLLHRKVAKGSKNIVKEPAMTVEQCEQALQVGIDMVCHLKEQGYQMIATGEMGIGNTTPSSALAAVLLDKQVEEVTGRGAGLSNAALEKKIQAVKTAVTRYETSYKAMFTEANFKETLRPDNYWRNLQLLSELGGYDIAGITGVFLGGAIYQVPIIIDGFISSVAALIATSMEPKVRNYMFASHQSKEPAGNMVLEALKLKPFVTCDMFLGEGTGAIAVLPLFQMAADVYNKMSTFQEIQVEQYKKFN